MKTVSGCSLGGSRVSRLSFFCVNTASMQTRAPILLWTHYIHIRKLWLTTYSWHFPPKQAGHRVRKYSLGRVSGGQTGPVICGTSISLSLTSADLLQADLRVAHEHYEFHHKCLVRHVVYWVSVGQSWLWCPGACWTIVKHFQIFFVGDPGDQYVQ